MFEDSIWYKIAESNLEEPGNYRYSDLGFYLMYSVVEKLTDDQFVVFLPSAPGGATGLVLIVRKDILEFPDLSLRDFRDILGFMGSGTKKLLYPTVEKW